MDISKYQTNPESVEGKWFTFDGAEFKIAYYDRNDFLRTSHKIGKRYREGIKADAALERVMTVEIMAETVLIDWRGVKSNGVDLPPTKANKILLLGTIAPFRDFVSAKSSELSNYTLEAEAEDAEALKSGDGVAA